MRKRITITVLSLAALVLTGDASHAHGPRMDLAWKARWIAAAPEGATPGLHMPIFRKPFRLDQRPMRAVAKISGLGQYELSINGEKIGGSVLTPGWTNYRKRVLYNSYDIVRLLRRGDNAIGVMLGNGLFNVPKVPHRYTKFVGSFGQPVLIAQLDISFPDGSSTVIATDGTWKTTPGPITFSHQYGGEDYDARLERPGWNQPHFNDMDWNDVHEVLGPGGEFVAETIPAVEVMQRFAPVGVTKSQPGKRIYDLGQNFSGWPDVVVHGPAGSVVFMLPGESLDGHGLVSQESSKGPQWFTYTLKGVGRERWHPRFSYWGFRYVQVEAPVEVQVVSLEGQFIHSSAPVIGEFSCSKELFNRIHKLIDHAIESNMQTVLTDCPHREKLGWLEQTHLLGSSIMYNYDLESLYAKMADDMGDAQTETGLVPSIAPEYVVFEGAFRDSPEWGSAVVLSPWRAYTHFGRKEILASHYGQMKRYVEYLAGREQNGILSYGLGDWYDIGPGPPGVSQLTSLGVTATAIYYDDLIVMQKIARLLGNQQDALRWKASAQRVFTEFNRKFYDRDTGVYDRGSQTDYAIPLALGLVPEEQRSSVLRHLIQEVRNSHNHATAGDIGFHFVIQALSEGGRSDVIYDLLSNLEPPSYASQLAHGATTLCEAWDCNPGSSQNHFMLGHAEEWFYRYLAGIDFDLSRPPGEQLVLRPTPVGDITNASATYQTPGGMIESRWRIRDRTFLYDIVIPPGMTAEVLLPSSRDVRLPQLVSSGHHHLVSALN